ncbi:hypothetical protein RIF29_31467 [Crotalaria pallida]|uniref:H/ACA ribonucleoprotein complex non-core subunit NAF1 n=1 Tax=Crotalaria pallida TaxID=3830 RepID=A0AAN9EHY4_CROPI
MAAQTNNIINNDDEDENGIEFAADVKQELDPNSNGHTHVEGCVKIETLEVGDYPIEEAVEKISLVGEPLVTIQGNAIKDETETETDSESGSRASSSEESGGGSSSSSGNSDSDSDGDDDVGNDDDENEDDEKKEKGEVEEGEIRDFDVDVDDEGESDDNDNEDEDEDEDEMVNSSMVDDDDIDVLDIDDDDDVKGGPIRSKNEIENLPPVPPVEVTLEPHHQVQPVGVVMSVLGAQVIVEGIEKHEPLSEGSILWMTESRKPLGLVDEIFGPVKNPYYVVRFNSENEVPEGIQAGALVSFVPEFVDYVLKNKDLYKKGYDASGANDEELSDEYEFSDDEKEAEYRRMQRTAKRDKTDQNHGKRKINRKQVSPKQNVVPSIPDALAPPLPNHGNSSPFPGNWQGHFRGPTMTPPFPTPPSNAVPNFATNGVWTNGTTLPQQPQPAFPPNAFPTNGMPWFPPNTQIPHQLPVAGFPFPQQLHPNQGPLSPAMFPGVQPNMFAQPMYAQGPFDQNQMAYGFGAPFPQIQPPVFAAQQGFPSGELQPQGNLNLQPSTIPGAPRQFRPGASASRGGGRTFRGAGRRGRRPPAK